VKIESVFVEAVITPATVEYTLTLSPEELRLIKDAIGISKYVDMERKGHSGTKVAELFDALSKYVK
jgi:hypothetical protein